MSERALESNLLTMRKRLAAYLVLSQVGIFSLFIPTPVSARHPDLYALVKHELAAGQTVKLTKRARYGGTKISNLPSYVFSDQVGTQFAVGTARLVVITERDLNHPVLPVERQVRWAGILGSADDGQHWYKFFTIRDPKDPDTQPPPVYRRNDPSQCRWHLFEAANAVH